MRVRNNEPWDLSQEEFSSCKGHKEVLWEVKQSRSVTECCFENVPNDKGRVDCTC